MRERPHILSTRLDTGEVGQYVRALAAPGGGWYVPAHLARWAVLRAPVGAGAAIRVEIGTIERALAPFRVAGRVVNGIAFSMNTGTAKPDMSRLASWPDAAAELLAAVQPIGADVACPVPVQFTAPSVTRAHPPGFRQKSRPARRRAPGERPLRETVVATRLSGAEFTFVRQSAERAGLDAGDHFRSCLLRCDPLRQRRLPRPAARALAAALEECGRQANNWRQIGRAHERRRWAVPPIVDDALAVLWDIRSAIVPILARWRP